MFFCFILMLFFFLFCWFPFFFLFLVLTACFFVKNSRGQLVIYQGAQQTGTSATCVVRTIYSEVSIPAGLNNQITSIKLTKGL